MSKYFTLGHPSAFSGIDAINRHGTLKNKNIIAKELESNETYTIKREAKRPRAYNPYYVWEKRKHLQIDLIDYSALKSVFNANRGFKYLFCAIDGFTRYAWVKPMKNKTDKVCVKTFNDILSEMGTPPPQRVVSDRGSEFTSELFLNNLRRLNITPVFVNYKAGIVERFQRSLQSLIAKYQHKANKKNFVDVLPLLLQTYNTRYHRTIKMPPQEAEKDINRFKIRAHLRKKFDKVKKKRPRFSIGDKVRVQKQTTKFSRGYDDIFTKQIFNVSKINYSLPIPMYSLTSFDGEEEIIANFYEQELQRVSGQPFEIRQILKKERLPGKGEFRVYAKVHINGEPFYAWIKEKHLPK